MRRRQQKGKRNHFALLVNSKAGGYSRKAVSDLLGAIKAANGSYSIFEPESAMDLLKQAEVVTGKRKASQKFPPPYAGGGPVTALVACGGDGTVNLVGRAAMNADLPLGILPQGRINNLARHYLGGTDKNDAIKKIVAASISRADCALASGLPFFGSIGLGFVPQLAEAIESEGLPRMAIGWSRIGSRSAADVTLKKTVIKVDSFRFEVKPIILNVNLIPYSAGLPLSPPSISDDGVAEILLDHEGNIGNFSRYIRLIYKGKYLYGDDVRLYRGQVIICHPVKGRTLYIDGELTEIPSDVLEIKMGTDKLSLFA